MATKARRIVCYPLKPKGGSTWKNNELRHSLRSLEKHFKGEYDAVYILGAYLPDWVNTDTVKFKMAPEYIDALEAAIKLAGPGGDILWMNDDILFMQDTTWEDLVKPTRRERTRPFTKEKAEKWMQEDNGWMVRLGEIMLRLCEEGHTTWKFSTHTPYWYEADKLKACMKKFGHLGYKVAIENAYYNLYIDEFGETPCRDKFRTGPRAKRFPMKRYGSVRFLNLTPNVSPWMRGFVMGRWPEPSRFETQ